MNDVQELRRQIKALQSERDEIAAVQCNRPEALAVVAAWAREAEAEGHAMLRRAVTPIGVAGQVDAEALTARGGHVNSFNAGALLAALLGHEALTTALQAHVAAVTEDGPDASARKARAAEIGVELDKLERAEEALIEASEGTNLPVDRRPDCRPEIVLGLRK